MSADRITYIDSSAIVKLAVREPESAALRRAIQRWGPLVSSAIARPEVLRALLRSGPEAINRGSTALRSIALVSIDEEILAAAGALQPPESRSLDAIHLATAAVLGRDLERLCTYDLRMAGAAQAAGITVLAPR